MADKQFEIEILLSDRFALIGIKLLEFLDYQELIKCKMVNYTWLDFIENHVESRKSTWIRVIHGFLKKHTKNDKIAWTDSFASSEFNACNLKTFAKSLFTWKRSTRWSHPDIQSKGVEFYSTIYFRPEIVQRMYKNLLQRRPEKPLNHLIDLASFGMVYPFKLLLACDPGEYLSADASNF